MFREIWTFCLMIKCYLNEIKWSEESLVECRYCSFVRMTNINFNHLL